ncbi:MAG: Mu-like prophage major head subunit gpT family protein [Candidatus Competibacter sp.]|nr:Mu-like prophage major head subunit gpT family protein [Candidatus Competibacter sp.]MDG4583398.1 Mu-like prophage major head subunit gpT family protein [Candidatus Competibacter sp.]
MSARSLSSRAIIGEFFLRLDQDLAGTWIPGVSREFQSDQESETYKWLGMSPAMREWVGGRQPRGMRANGITIPNKKYESTLEVTMDEIRRDKTGQVMIRVQEQAERANAHWASLLSTLIINGESTACYDGQYFFDTDHSEGDSGTQSNDITNDITTTTAPTASELQASILLATQAILGFKDDTGEPMNENAREFLVMIPVPYLGAAATALGATVISQTSNTLMALGSLGGFTYKLATNARLTWTTKLAVFRTDGAMSALIRQSEEAVKIAAQAEGSAEEFNNDRHLYGISARRNVGYGYWQKACLVTHT